MTYRTLALTFVLVPFLTGCVSSGALYSANVTNVALDSDNYQVVATNVSGESEAGYLFGVSGGLGVSVHAAALIRISGTGLLYKEAIEDFWTNFEADHGPVEGRSLAIVNVRYDADALNALGIYTRPRLSVRADVVEFE